MVQLEISESRIRHNAERVLERVRVPVWGVIKYDGYGAGLTRMASILREAGVHRFAVNEASEGLTLREAGFEEEILLLCPQPEALFEKGMAEGFLFSVGSLPYAHALADAARQRGAEARVHIAVDTGMGRFGFLPKEYESIRALYTTPGLRVEGIYSHFSAAGGPIHGTRAQFARFRALLSALERDGVRRGMAHMANSAAVFRTQDMELDAVRIGSAFLGRAAGATDPGLSPVGTLSCRVAAVRHLPRGSHAGYGGEVRFSRATDLAVLDAGCLSGVPALNCLDRFLHRYPVAEIDGQRVPIVATRSLSNAMADVTGLPVAPDAPVRIPVNPLRVDRSVERVVIP